MDKSTKSIVVTGAGGFIGGHLVKSLLADGANVRAIDKKPLDDWYQVADQAENLVLDVSDAAACRMAVGGANEVFNLAADMGGMGFIENNKALCMLSVLINTNMLLGGARGGRGALLLLLVGVCLRGGQATRRRCRAAQ